MSTSGNEGRNPECRPGEGLALEGGHLVQVVKAVAGPEGSARALGITSSGSYVGQGEAEGAAHYGFAVSASPPRRIHLIAQAMSIGRQSQ